MPATTWQSELAAALAAAAKASERILQLYETFAAMTSAPADISTQADKEAQEAIVGALRERFPTDGVCAEENTEAARSAPKNRDRFWVVDPIDGTRGFAVKNGEFAVMIGLVEAGAVKVGVVVEPAIGRTTYATRGNGCFVNRFDGPTARCVVATSIDLRRCMASISRSQSMESENKFRTTLGLARTTPTYSAGIKLGQVARGETDLYLGDYLGLSDWDICAGHILVEEAGGAVTTLDGKSIVYDGGGKSLKHRGILATNGRCHDATLRALATTGYSP